MNDLIIGQVVCSKAGRDKGQFMIVLGMAEGDYAYVANGGLRKADHPKRKKIKHLAKTNFIATEFRDKILGGKQVTNAEIKKILKSYCMPDRIGDENYKEV